MHILFNSKEPERNSQVKWELLFFAIFRNIGTKRTLAQKREGMTRLIPGKDVFRHLGLVIEMVLVPVITIIMLCISKQGYEHFRAKVVRDILNSNVGNVVIPTKLVKIWRSSVLHHIDFMTWFLIPIFGKSVRHL